MIKCNLAVLMAERGLNISELSKATGISRNALSALYNNTGKGVQFDTLATLCDFFEVDVGELLTKLDIKIDFNSLKKVSENCYTAVILVNAGYKKISGEVQLIIDEEDLGSVELVIPFNIYQIFSSIKHIEIDFVKREVIFPILNRIKLSVDPQNYIVSVEEGHGSESGKWLSHTSFRKRRSVMSEEPF